LENQGKMEVQDLQVYQETLGRKLSFKTVLELMLLRVLRQLAYGSWTWLNVERQHRQSFKLQHKVMKHAS